MINSNRFLYGIDKMEVIQFPSSFHAPKPYRGREPKALRKQCDFKVKKYTLIAVGKDKKMAQRNALVLL